MSRFSDLRYMYQTRKNLMDDKLLHELIKESLIKIDDLMETIEDISEQQEQQERLSWSNQSYNEPMEPHNIKEDLD